MRESGLAPMSSNGSVYDPKCLARDRRAAGKQKTQWIWKAQYPLAHRLFGKDLVHQQRSTLCFDFLRPAVVGHASGAATGAKTAPFTAERHEVLGMASLAPALLTIRIGSGYVS